MDAESVQKNEGKPQVRKRMKKEPGFPLADTQKYIHELKMHQVELEIQNEEVKGENQHLASQLDKYTHLYNYAPFSYFSLTEDGVIEDLNIPAASLLNHDRSGLIKKNFRSFLSPGYEPLFTVFLEKVFLRNKKEYCEVALLKNDEKLCFLHLEAMASAGEKLCYLTASDITERRDTEETLKKQQQLYQSAFRKFPAVALLLDPDTENIIDANPEAITFYGFSLEQLRKMKFSDLTLRSQREIKSFLLTNDSGQKDDFIVKQKLAGGVIRDVKICFDPIRFGDCSFLLSTMEDITGKKHTEEVNKEAKFWSKAAHQNTGTGTFTLDFFSDSWSSSEFLDEIIGIDSDQDWTINGFMSLIHPDHKAGFQYYIYSEVIGRKQTFDKEFLIIRPCDGKECWVKGNAGLEFDEEGRLSRLTGTLQDITERKRSEEILEASEKMYHLLMSSSPDGIVIFGPDGKISEFSDFARKQFRIQNKEDLLGQHFLRFIPRDERRKIDGLIRKTMSDGIPQSTECKLMKLDNSLFISEISLTQINRTEDDQKAFIAIIRDISLRKKREKELIHHDRMSHLGEMATGMAHEINQPLNVISLTLDNILHEIKLKDSLHDAYLQHKSNKIFDNIVKIKNLIEHIREFARDSQSYSWQSFDINEAIKNTVSVMLVQFDENRIDLTLDLEEKLDLLMGDTYKIEQVIMNLMLNAKDALEEKEIKSNGNISKVVKIRSYQEKNMICIEVSDNGIGIKANEMEKIMHPFYTTKETGKGVGLGLSIAYGIITEMNGRIEVESKYLIGTTFMILLPVPESQIVS
jgi:PAS domain S-box-containing protein